MIYCFFPSDLDDDPMPFSCFFAVVVVAAASGVTHFTTPAAAASYSIRLGCTRSHSLQRRVQKEEQRRDVHVRARKTHSLFLLLTLTRADQFFIAFFWLQRCPFSAWYRGHGAVAMATYSYSRPLTRHLIQSCLYRNKYLPPFLPSLGTLFSKLYFTTIAA